MASFVNANLGSDSDSDDQDYDPTKEAGHVVSEEENSGDEENAESGTKKLKKSKKKRKEGGRIGGIFLEEDEQTKAENETKRKEFEQEKIELAQEAEKQKSEDLWADFKNDASSSSLPKKPKSSGGLGFLTSINKPVKKAAAPKTKAFSKPKSSIDSLFESFESGTSGKIGTETEKNVADKEKPQNSLIGSIFENINTNKSANKSQQEKKVENENDQDENSKMKITKVFDFAGESVEVTKEVEKDSKEAKQFQKSQEKQQEAQKRPGGLNSIMGTITGKAPKMGTLDKSKLDWNKFVDEEGIKEELVTHNRGKDGYVEKQQFLERADVRRFEIEKSAREKSRKTLNR